MSLTNINAWREILARVFDGFTVHQNVKPEWLINPDTNRHLKLDLVYPEIGIAIRFAGLQKKRGSRRLSLEEEQQQQLRDNARAQQCREHGVNLVVMEAITGDPRSILGSLRMALSDASRRLANSDRRHNEKAELIERVSQARMRLESIARNMRTSANLGLYAELWQDRQYAEALPDPEPGNAPGSLTVYTVGMTVRHLTFGDGIVQEMKDDKGERLVTVGFADDTQRTFSARLVHGKLAPRDH
jgi:hypothetical protein